MQKVILSIILLLFMLLACSKEEVETTVSKSAPSDTYSDANLDAFLSNGGLKSGLRFIIRGKESNTMTNYLLGGQPGFIPTETALNTDSMTSSSYKRALTEQVTIGGVLHGVFDVTDNFYNRPSIETRCFVKDTTANYFVITNYTQNHAKQVANILVIEKETSIPLMDYYDFDFSKWKKKSRYRLNSDTYRYREFLASRSANTNNFRLPIN